MMPKNDLQAFAKLGDELEKRDNPKVYQSDYDVLSMYGILVSDAEIAEWLWENELDNLTGDDLEVARVKARYEILAARSLETDGNQ